MHYNNYNRSYLYIVLNLKVSPDTGTLHYIIFYIRTT